MLSFYRYNNLVTHLNLNSLRSTTEPSHVFGMQGHAERGARQRHATKAAGLCGPPLAVVDAWLSDAAVTLPFDKDPGTAERFTELWAKAFKEVCARALPALLLSTLLPANNGFLHTLIIRFKQGLCWYCGNALQNPLDFELKRSRSSNAARSLNALSM